MAIGTTVVLSAILFSTVISGIGVFALKRAHFNFNGYHTDTRVLRWELLVIVSAILAAWPVLALETRRLNYKTDVCHRSDFHRMLRFSKYAYFVLTGMELAALLLFNSKVF